MRVQGKIKSWKDDKGFGFISPNGGGSDVFLHISAFRNKHRRPAVNNIVTYELIFDDKKRPKAINVLFAGESLQKEGKSSDLITALVSLVILLVVGYIIYERVTHPGSTIQATIYKSIFERSALNNNSFQCRGKHHCSEMTSCAEAFFYQEHCGGTEMDGDHDGIPCEQQWCN